MYYKKSSGVVCMQRSAQVVCLLGDSMRAEVEHACHIMLVCNRGSSGIAARESDHTNQYMWKFHSSC